MDINNTFWIFSIQIGLYLIKLENRKKENRIT